MTFLSPIVADSVGPPARPCRFERVEQLRAGDPTDGYRKNEHIRVLALAIYAPLRAMPIKAIRERAELASLDAQLVSAFGDLPVLLDDPVQAAIVRELLAETIRWVRDRGCDEVVLIAHSGGAIVSFSTLLDDEYRDLPVAKLITRGQGLSLGWRLEQTTGPFAAGNPIWAISARPDPGSAWVDFWASYDPAPAGQLVAVDHCPWGSLVPIVAVFAV